MGALKNQTRKERRRQQRQLRGVFTRSDGTAGHTELALRRICFHCSCFACSGSRTQNQGNNCGQTARHIGLQARLSGDFLPETGCWVAQKQAFSVKLCVAASRLFSRCFFRFLCLCSFFKIVVVRRAVGARLAHVFFAAMRDALLLGVNVGIKTGGFCSHHWLSKYGGCVATRMLRSHTSH